MDLTAFIPVAKTVADTLEPRGIYDLVIKCVRALVNKLLVLARIF